MINEQVMMDTVQRMLDAGIDEATILSTLVDTGLTQEEANSVMQKVKTPVVQETLTQQVQAAPAEDVQLLRSQVEAQSQQQELHETTTHTMLNMQDQKIDDMTKKVDEVKDVITNQTSAIDPTLSYRLSELERKLEEVNAASKASIDLLTKILENNRKILTELEAKK
jgi:cytochrome P450